MPRFDSNTTLVKVKFKEFLNVSNAANYSNTTLVKVKLKIRKSMLRDIRDSNTTLVKVKSVPNVFANAPLSIQIQHLLKLNF